MKTTLYVQNLKCIHCEAIIMHMLSKLKNITNVSVKRQYATVTFKHKTAKDVNLVKKALSKIGFPPYGEKNNFIRKAKSHISCSVIENKKK